NKKYYKEHAMDDTMLLVLNQIIKYNVDSSTKELYLKGKVYQLFSLLFDSNSSQPNTTCPYMMNDNNLKKINLAKEIIINEYSSPPTLLELSSRVDLSLRRLKEGFKEIYGKPVFQFLLEYKMAMAKRFLIEEDYNINEVSIKLGYSTASHFISSFKKRYGVTPKVYVKNFYKN
ncbi:MAG: AraC family transcriptional regulator, partial [Flavobacteriales bacterium]|nr:AraC family transcriptional regulator [Flavobacteriales bacterium]